MKPGEQDDPLPVLRDEDLVQLQLQIAQRADQLAYGRGASRQPSDDFECWLQAEREVLGSADESALYRPA